MEEITARDANVTARQTAVGFVLGSALSLILAGTAAAEFQVNTQTLGRQGEPEVASDDAGNVVAVWRSGIELGQSHSIVAQRYDASGAPVGSEFTVTLPGHHHHPDVAMAPDGRFVVTWMDGSLPSADGDQSGVFARLYSSLGVPVGTAIQVNTYTTSWQTHPKVAVADSADFVVIWESHEQDGDETGIFGQRFDSGGTPAGNEFQVNTYTTDVQGSGVLAVDTTPDGAFIATWHSRGQDDGDNSAGGGGVYAQRYAADGAPVGGEFRVNSTITGPQGFGGVDVETHPDGSFLIAWNGNNFSEPFLPGGDVFGRRYASDGSALGLEFRINEKAAGHQFYPAIAADDAGNFLVAYRGDDGDRAGVFGRYYAADGTPVGPDFRINASPGGDQNSPAITSDPAGNFFVAWTSECRSYNTDCEEDQDGDELGVFAERFSSPPPVCDEEPLDGCDEAVASKVRIKQGKLGWIWKSDALSTGFGQPVAGLTNYILCLYREDLGASSRMLQAALPAGEGWTGSRDRGNYRFSNKLGTPQGLARVKLKGRVGKKARIKVKGSGAGLEPVTMPIGQFTKITTQLVNGEGDCWESEYYAPAITNSQKSFKAEAR